MHDFHMKSSDYVAPYVTSSDIRLHQNFQNVDVSINISFFRFGTVLGVTASVQFKRNDMLSERQVHKLKVKWYVHTKYEV